jgi:TRAP transporter TAXI family solute receptor
MFRLICKTIVFVYLATPLLSSQFITIGTGDVSGTYYPTGKNICKYMNRYSTHTNIRCSVEATGGSIYNIDKINNNELDFAIVQSDILYKTKNTNLRSVMAIYPELFTLVTRKDANINSLKDLKNKRINIGNKGSGNESTALALFEAIGFKISDLKFASYLKSSQMLDALIDNKIDGYFYMVGHPAKNIIEASNEIDVKIISLQNDKIDKFIEQNSYLTYDSVPKHLYKGNDKSISTFAVKAVLVTNKYTDDKIVYSMVKAMVENFEQFKKEHSAYRYITKKSLLNGLSIPLHNGAKKYYKNINLIENLPN